MKKTEGELLREYSRIIAEAQDQPDGFAGEDPFEEETSSDYGDADENDYDPNQDELAIDDARIRKEDEGEPEFNDIADNDDPIAQLSSYLDELDPHEMTFSEAIQKFLHEHNLELTPKNGLSNKAGEV